jgi:hypothetical protein
VRQDYAYNPGESGKGLVCFSDLGFSNSIVHATTEVAGSNLVSGDAIVIHFMFPDISRLFDSVPESVLSFKLCIVNFV